MTIFDIQKEINNIIKREGEFVNHPADNGGPTKYGITQKTLTMWLGREATPAAVEALTLQTARDIYYTNYYIRTNIDDMPDMIKPIMLDMAVNSGKHGIKLLQDALLCHGYDCGKVDGRIGQRTIDATNAACAEIGSELINILVRRRIIFYEDIVKQDETQRVFLAGWIARAEEFLPDNERVNRKPLKTTTTGNSNEQR